MFGNIWLNLTNIFLLSIAVELYLENIKYSKCTPNRRYFHFSQNANIIQFICLLFGKL